MRNIFLILALLVVTVTSVTFSQDEPIPLPEGFNHELNLIGDEVNGEMFHRVHVNAKFLARLLENGTQEDVALAEKMIPGILAAQDVDPESPTYGGFKWELETPLVEDLNAVEFLLDGLIPMMIKNEHKLSEETAMLLRESIRLALDNVKRVDVGLKYTNIVLKDITNSALGGELLRDTAIAKRGYRRLDEWMTFTDKQGGSHYEFNALPYTAIGLDVLSKLARLVEDENTGVLAKMMLARMSISAALHIHPPTGRWAGPHGRAYHNSYISEGGWYILDEQEMKTLQRWIEEDILPEWMSEAMDPELMPDEISETVSIDDNILISTYKTVPYAFGVASRNMYNQSNRFIAWQSNVFSLLYQQINDRLPGVIYTRYITNDDWLGDFSAGPGRPTNMLIPDVGHFQGVQERNRAIGLYIPRHMGALEHYSSAKSVIAIPRWDRESDKIWIDDQLVEKFPADVATGSTVVVESGEVFVAFKPFVLTDLGAGSTMKLREMGDEDRTLVFEMYNYQGPPKAFWELAWPGAFFQGWPQNGWYAEVAEKGTFADGGEFASEVKRGLVIDTVAPKFTYSGTEERKWKVQYERDGKVLGMEVDLFDWFTPAKRWNQDGEIKWPMMKSNFAVQDITGNITVNEVSLTCGKKPAWLFVSPDRKTIVASYHGPEAHPLNIQAPHGSIDIDSIEKGLIVWKDGKITIDAIGLKGKKISKY